MDWLLASVNTAYVTVFKDASKPAAERVPEFAAQAKGSPPRSQSPTGTCRGEWFACSAA